MEELFDGLECRLKVSGMVADLFMMEILKSAMDEAYGRICSKEGDLGRLNDRSRFCELAIVQLEWCLRFLREEMDVYIVESGREREKLVSDLVDTRDHMQRRMEEIEAAISEKDLELTERAVVESELRRELELRDEEVRGLRAMADRDDIRRHMWIVEKDQVGGGKAIQNTNVFSTGSGTMDCADKAFDEESEATAFSKNEEPVVPSESSNGNPVIHANNLVAELIRNHESVIRKKIHETSWTREIYGDRGHSPAGHGGDLDLFRKNIRVVAAKLEVIIKEINRLLSIHDGLKPGDTNSKVTKFVGSNPTTLEGSTVRLCHQCRDYDIEAEILQDIYRIMFCDMVKQSNNAMKTLETEKLVGEKIDQIVVSEIIKDTKLRIRHRENGQSVDNANPETMDLFTTKKIIDRDHLEENRLRNTRMLIEEEDSIILTSGEVNSSELGIRSETSVADNTMAQDRTDSVVGKDEEYKSTPSPKIEELHRQEMQSVLMHLKHSSQSVLDLEAFACEKLGANTTRLDALGKQLNTLVGQVDLLRKNRSLYQKAFTRRCCDLQLAEAEVDLLGDEVDALQGLLKKIYVALEIYAPVFQHHSGMMDVLSLIRKELPH